MKVLAEESYSWMLFGDGEARFLSVLCGRSAQYMIDIELTPIESSLLRAGGSEYAAQLASSVQSHPDTYAARKTSLLESHPGLAQAISQWRAFHDASP